MPEIYPGAKVVPLVIKKGVSGGQKFRIPFKNNGAQEIEIDFTFAKQAGVITGPKTSSQDEQKL